MSRIWLEAKTGKQSLLVHYLAVKFEKMGHTVLITSRPYSIDRSNSNFDRLGRSHVSIGKYGGASLQSKIRSEFSRAAELMDVVIDFGPNLLISFPSPEAFRVAFGLAIPCIQINDTPHAVAVNKLTISLSNALVHSEAISKESFSPYGVTNHYPYGGVDECLWLKDIHPERSILNELDVEEDNYIVIRCEESKASYFQRMYSASISPGDTFATQLISKIRERDSSIKIVAFPRYPEQEKILQDLNIIIPSESLDSTSLYKFAKFVVTGGGTMAREAALTGTPSAYTFPQKLDVSEYIKNRGFPITHHPNLATLNELTDKIFLSAKISETERDKLINQLETPFDGVMRAIKGENILF